jgi:hypothetical protein
MATGLLLDTVSLPMQSVHGYRTEAYSIGFLERIKRLLLSHEGASAKHDQHYDEARIEIGFTGSPLGPGTARCQHFDIEAVRCPSNRASAFLHRFATRVHRYGLGLT